MKKLNEINEKIITALEYKIKLLDERNVINEKIIEIQKELLFLYGVVGQSEQLPNRCSVCGRTNEERMTMTSMCGVSACPY